MAASGCDQARVQHKPRLLTDNEASYIATDLADWLDKRKIEHLHGAPCHPQTQGKIERWHQMLESRICWRTTISQVILTLQIEAFVDHLSTGETTTQDQTEPSPREDRPDPF